MEGADDWSDVFLNVAKLLASPRNEGQVDADNIDGSASLELIESLNRLLAKGFGERHRQRSPTYWNDFDARLGWWHLLVFPSDNGHLVSALRHMASKVVDNRTHPAPSWRVLTRDHHDVHGCSSEQCCLKVTRGFSCFRQKFT